MAGRSYQEVSSVILSVGCEGAGDLVQLPVRASPLVLGAG